MEAKRNRLGLVKILLFLQVAALAVVMWLAVQGTGCALAAPCPTGSSIIFDQTVGIQGGTAFTNTFTSIPTAARLTTFPDASGTVALLNRTQDFTGTVGFTGTIDGGGADVDFGDDIDLNTNIMTNIGASGQDILAAGVRTVNGLASAPSFSWKDETTLGFYRSGAGEITLSINANEYTWSATTSDMNSNTITEIGNPGSELLDATWTMTGTGDKTLTVDSSNLSSLLILDAANVGGESAAINLSVGGSNQVTLQSSADFAGLQINPTSDRVAIIDGYLEVDEISAPGAGGADTVRIYAIVGGGSLTDLAAVFQDGTVDIFAQETTEPTDAVVAAPDETVGVLVIVRPHPGTVQLVARIPGFGDWVISEKDFHAEEKIGWAQGAEKPLPVDWYVESAADQDARLACLGLWSKDNKVCTASTTEFIITRVGDTSAYNIPNGYNAEVALPPNIVAGLSEISWTPQIGDETAEVIFVKQVGYEISRITVVFSAWQEVPVEPVEIPIVQ